MPEVSYADLSAIRSQLGTISHNIGVVNSNVGLLSEAQSEIIDKQANLESNLAQFRQEFLAFVAMYEKLQNLQLAETRVGNLKQDLQIKFGYYAEIRRMATGILQGVDSGVISDDTIRATTEEVAIKAPGYWLASALVACASWIRDDRDTCEKALQESLRRDDYKSTLFFMLLTRRLGRNDASVKWLERYFIHQDPHDLDREFLTVLEAVTTGVFQPKARIVMMQHVSNWLTQLTEGDRFIDQQRANWVRFFDACKPPLPTDAYPMLRKYCKNWDALAHVLRSANVHDVLVGHFNKVVASNKDQSASAKAKLDEILNLLVTNFDDEELPLQKQVRFNQLIIEKKGDLDDAQAVMDAEESIFKEKVDFLQILTNAAFNPEAAGVTSVTQALAVSISQPWIIEAHDGFTAQYRSSIPKSAELAIDGHVTSSNDGSDEIRQVAAMEEYYQGIENASLAEVSSPGLMILLGVLVGAAGLLIGPAGLLVSIPIGGIIAYNAHNGAKKKREEIKSSIGDRKAKGVEVLRGCLAEVVDFRRELAIADAKDTTLRHLLESIVPESFSSVSRDTSRNLT